MHRIKGVRSCKWKLALMPPMPPIFYYTFEGVRPPQPPYFYPRAIATFTTDRPPSVDWTKLPPPLSSPPVAPPSSLDPLPYIICSEFRIWRCNGVSHPWRMKYVPGRRGEEGITRTDLTFGASGDERWGLFRSKDYHRDQGPLSKNRIGRFTINLALPKEYTLSRKSKSFFLKKIFARKVFPKEMFQNVQYIISFQDLPRCPPRFLPEPPSQRRRRRILKLSLTNTIVQQQRKQQVTRLIRISFFLFSPRTRECGKSVVGP